MLRVQPKETSREEAAEYCVAYKSNAKRNKRFRALFILLVPALTLFFAGGFNEFVLITWLAGILFAGWISGIFFDGNQADCSKFSPCRYECPLNYPEWCPNRNRPERGQKSPFKTQR